VKPHFFCVVLDILKFYGRPRIMRIEIKQIITFVKKKKGEHVCPIAKQLIAFPVKYLPSTPIK